MSDKIAFITGGNRGIGFQTALELGAAGVKVIIGSRDLAQGEAAAAKLRDQGIDAAVIKFDVTQLADHQAAYDYFDSNFSRLDILVNNAGLAKGSFPGNGPAFSASQVPLKVLHSIFETNFFSVVALTNTLLPLIRKSPAGRIVNLSSISARSPFTPTANPPSTRASSSPTTPQRRLSTPTPFTSHGNSATPPSRSTPPTPAGSKPIWVAPAQPWTWPTAQRLAQPSRSSPTTAPPAAISTRTNHSPGNPLLAAARKLPDIPVLMGHGSCRAARFPIRSWL